MNRGKAESRELTNVREFSVRFPFAYIPRRDHFMPPRLFVSPTFAVLLLTGTGLATEPLKSGPPVGATNNRSGFLPQFVAGPSAGDHLCPV